MELVPPLGVFLAIYVTLRLVLFGATVAITRLRVPTLNTAVSIVSLATIGEIGALYVVFSILAAFEVSSILLALLVDVVAAYGSIAAALQLLEQEPQPVKRRTAIVYVIGQLGANSVLASCFLAVLYVPTGSMMQTIRIGDHVLVLKFRHDARVYPALEGLISLDACSR